MRNKLLIVTLLLSAIAIIGCVKKLQQITTSLEGRVIEESGFTPLNDVSVKVTNGEIDYKSTNTGVDGKFSLMVNYGDLTDNYYLYISDGQHFKKLPLNGVGTAKYNYRDIALYKNDNVNPVAPSVTTTTPSNISTNSATCGGKVVSDGGAAIIQRGVCYSTSQNPTTSNSVITCGTGTGEFSCLLTGLSENTKYYVKAYAINSVGTSYGDQKTFKTTSGGGGGGSSTAPTVTTTTPTDVTSSTAKCGGNVTSDGGDPVTERGVCYSTSQNPTTSSTVVKSGSGTGSFTCNLTGLSANTTYYVRAYAINGVDTSYGTQKSFTTTNNITKPTVTTTAATNVSTNSATCGGNVTSDGGANVTARGVCWSTSQNPTISNQHTNDGTGTGQFTSTITGLSANTTYYVKAYATNSAGTSYGTQKSFKTQSSGGGTAVEEFIECFESEIPSNWAVIDADGDGYSFMAYGDFAGHNSTSCISSASFINNIGALTPNNYLVSPRVTIVNGSTFSFWACAQDNTWTAEHFGVAISQTSQTNASSFTTIQEWTMQAKNNGYRRPRGYNEQGEWYQYTVDLSNYAGNDIYIAIRHFNCTDQYWLNVDDAQLSTGGSSASAPTVTTTTPTNVTTNSATCGGNVTSDGGATVTQRGVCYSTSQNPTTSNMVVTSGSGNGAFTCNLTGLSPNTTYYVRAFAINSEGTAYGSQVPFTTTSESISGWLYYDNPNIIVGHVGLTNGGTLYWANMYPPSVLAPYAGTSVVKLEAHLDLTGNYILQIYQGGNDGPSTLLLNDNCYVSSAGGYVTFTFGTPVSFDASQNLWVVIGKELNAGEYTAGYGNQIANPNSRWARINNGSWYVDEYTWTLHTYVSNTGEKGGRNLVEIRHTNNDNDIKTNIDN